MRIDSGDWRRWSLEAHNSTDQAAVKSPRKHPQQYWRKYRDGYGDYDDYDVENEANLYKLRIDWTEYCH